MKWTWIVICLGLAFCIRFYQIDHVPASLYFDEIDNGYQARSLLETGKDYQGGLSPFYVHSVNDIRPPLSTYFTLVSTLIFKDPVLQIKMSQIICGVLSVWLVILITNLLTQNIKLAILTGLITALNPWQIQFSRASQEMIVMQFCYLLGLFLFFKGVLNHKFIYLLSGSAILSLAMYSYRTMSLYVPFTFVMLGVIFYHQLVAFKLKQLGLVIGTVLVITVPFLIFTTLKAPDVPRINQLAVTSDSRVPIQVQRNREVDSGDLEDSNIGKQAIWSAYLFHSKPLSWLGAFFNNYLQTFSVEFLFLTGDLNLRHTTGLNGVLLPIDAIGLILGTIYLSQNLKNPLWKFLLVWLLTAPIPASLTFDGARHGARLFILAAPLIILTGLGWWYLFEQLTKQQIIRNKFLSWAVIFWILVIWMLEFSTYYHGYLIHYPINSARWFGYGFKQAVLKITQIESQYQRVYLTNAKEPPMIYYLFWSNTSPKFLQEYGTDFSTNKVLGKKLDKYKPLDENFHIDKQADLNQMIKPDSLYLVSADELPNQVRDNIMTIRSIKVLDVINYPDHQPAFYLISK